MASRGVMPKELAGKTIWWQGPPQLGKLLEESAPIPTVELPNDPEVKVEKQVMAVQVREKPWILQKSEKYEKFEVAVGVISYCILFGDLSNKKSIEKRSLVAIKAQVTAAILRETQRYYMPDELRALSEDTRRKFVKHEHRNSQLQGLDASYDEKGLVRVGERTRYNEVIDTEVQGLVVPKNSIAARQLAVDAHRKMGHMSTNVTLLELRRDGYWIVHARAIIGTVIRKCATCTRYRGKPVAPKMGELPESRTTPAEPFTHSATDVFGPFMVKRGRGREKRWMCIFMCQVTRAIHLEMLVGMDVSSFVNALRRFMGRRGPVKSLACDRGTNFRAAESELRSIVDASGSTVRHELSKKNCELIEFKFNPPRASHMGGSWERMIRTVRSVLNPLLLKNGELMVEDDLRTMMVEVEAIVNSRPLSYVETTGVGNPKPLSPDTLLTLRTQPRPPVGNLSKEKGYYRKRWAIVQTLAEQFWFRWRNEVLQQLNVRSKWSKDVPNLQENDVVIVVDETAPRCDWPLGRIAKVFGGRDDRVRKVDVQVGKKTYLRAVHKLIKIE